MRYLILASAIAIAMGAVANAQTAGGQLTIDGTITGSMTLVVSTDVAGANIAGSGSSAGSFNFGPVSAATPDGAVALNVIKSAFGGGYNLATSVDVIVTAANGTSPNYNLSAAIDNTDNFTYQVGGVSMTTTPQIVGSNIAYSIAHQVLLNIIVPTAAPGATVARIIFFTATAN
jgi:hypothetical protein